MSTDGTTQPIIDPLPAVDIDCFGKLLLKVESDAHRHRRVRPRRHIGLGEISA